MLDKAIYQRVWQFSWPAIICNLSVPLLGLVDSAVLGHLPAAFYLGGVAIGSTLFSVIFWAFGFLRMGTTGLVAQAYGRGDNASVYQWLLFPLMLAVVVGFTLMLLTPLIISQALPLFNGGIRVSEQARIYFEIRMLSAPAVLCNYALIGWFLGMQAPLAPLAMLITANGINVILDFVLVLSFGMATEGVAIATVCADYLSLILGVFLVFRLLLSFEYIFDWSVLRNINAYKQIILLNRHLFIRTLCLLFTIAFFTSRGAQQGDVVVAANALLLSLLVIISNGLDGFAHAAESLTGEAIGKKSSDQFRVVVKTTGVFSALCGLLFVLFFAVGGNWLLSMLTDISEVYYIAVKYLPWLIVMPVVAVWSYWLDGVFIGAICTRVMQNTTLVATVGVFLPAWYFSQSLGNHGLWLAYTLFMTARSVSLIIAYRWFERNNLW